MLIDLSTQYVTTTEYAAFFRYADERPVVRLIRKALDYCRLDVELERDLHLHLAQQPLRLPPRPDRRELNEILYYADGSIKRIPDATGAISTK